MKRFICLIVLVVIFMVAIVNINNIVLWIIELYNIIIDDIYETFNSLTV